jgi:hypothetical protein
VVGYRPSYRHWAAFHTRGTSFRRSAKETKPTPRVGKRQRKKPTPPQRPRRKGLDTSSVDRVGTWPGEYSCLVGRCREEVGMECCCGGMARRELRHALLEQAPGRSAPRGTAPAKRQSRMPERAGAAGRPSPWSGVTPASRTIRGLMHGVRALGKGSPRRQAGR